MTLVDSRSGYNITTQEAKALGEKIQPLLKQGLSPYAILQAHPEITEMELRVAKLNPPVGGPAKCAAVTLSL